MTTPCPWCSDRRADMRDVVRAAELAERAGRPTTAHLTKIARLKRLVAEHTNCSEKAAI